jgi:putative peptidoglycan lipid II flippase
MSKKFTSTIAGASIFISLLGLISRGLGFIREIIFANNFGLEKEFDLYLVGAVLPITINTILLYIGQNYFIPEFQKINSSNQQHAQNYFKQSILLFSAAGLILALLLFFTSGMIVDFYMQSADSASRETALLVFKIFLVTIPFSAAISVLSALLQSLYEFKYPAISILFLNIAIIILLLFLSDRFGVYVIPIGYVVGTFLQFIYLLIKSRRYLNFDSLINSDGNNFYKSILNSSIVIIILIESIGQMYSIFDRYFYGYIGPGGVASLNYAFIIFSLPISIFSFSLATVVFPKITQAIVNTSEADLQKIYSDSISINILIFMPLAFVLYYFGDTILKIAFERGKFLGESTIITYHVLKCYSVSLVFYSVYTVLNKMFYSLNLAKLLLVITIVGIILKMIFNSLLVHRYQQDGLAVSTSLSFVFFFSASYLVINRKLGITDKTLFINEFSFYFINSCVSLLIFKILSNLFPVSNIITDTLLLFIFLFIYFLNLILVKHKIIIILNQLIPVINFNNTLKKFKRNQ